jgi:hypothetical protein
MLVAADPTKSIALIVLDLLIPSSSHTETYRRIFSKPCPTSIFASGLFDRSVQNQRRN